MPQPISPKPKTRFKYFREVRAGWLVAGLAGLAFTLAYPSVIEPRLNSDDSGDVPATAPANQQQESGWDKQLHRNTPNPKKPQQGSDDQNLPRDVSGSSGSTGGGISPNRERTPNQGGPFGSGTGSGAFGSGSGSGSGSGTGTGTGSGSGSGSGAGTGTGTGTDSGSGSGSGAFGSGSDEGHGMGGVFGNG